MEIILRSNGIWEYVDLEILERAKVDDQLGTQKVDLALA